MAPKVSVAIKYSKPGTIPPMYLAGSFSEPAWQPHEMECTIKEDGEHEYRREVEVQEGADYQYKFRIGEGDWWILNEDSPTVTDEIGNRNNLLSIPKTEETKHEREQENKPTGVLKANDPEMKVEAVQEDSQVNGDSKIARTHQHEAPQIMPAVEPLDPIAAVVETENPDENEVDTVTKISDKKSASTHMIEEVDPAAAEEFNMLVTGTPAELASTPAQRLPNVHDSIEQETEFKEVVKSQEVDEQSLPTVVVEKTDSEPRHGDNFGSDATIAQKDAYQAHALNSKPDHVATRSQYRTPEIAATAADVADVAAALDRDAPTPPISDEEAGRIGFRRMSNTPIPEVAATAAEVADVAASLDGSYLPLIVESLRSFDPQDRTRVDSGRSTPAEERVPKFSHECCELPDHVEPCQHEPIGPLPEECSSHEDSSEEIDFNDPSIEMFPTERNAILAKLKEIQERLPEDETRVEGVLPSPVVGPNYRPNSNGRLHTPSPALRGLDRSSSLQSINEEVDNGDFLSLTDTSKANGILTLGKLPEGEEPSVPESSSSRGRLLTENSGRQQIAQDQETRGRSFEQGSEAEPTETREEVTAAQFLPLRREASLVSDGSNDSGVAQLPPQVKKVEVLETRPGTPPKLLEGDLKLGLTQRIPPTPFVVSDRQLGHDEEQVQEVSPRLAPSITIVPAAPAGSSIKTEKTPTSYVKAKSTAMEDENADEAHQRKRSSIRSPERPLTPSSVRSAGKEAEERNFLKAFWKVVFIDWIGGFIMKLCGGDRKRQKTTTLLAVGVVTIIAIAPAMLFSETAREVASHGWSSISETASNYWHNWRGNGELL